MLDIEKTKFLVINGKSLAIDEFPKNIRQEVDLFDDIKSDVREIEKKAKVLILALTAQNAKVTQLIEQYTKSTEVQTTEQDVQ